MSLARLKRLQKLEARQPTGDYWRDPFEAAMAPWPDLEAVAAAKACWLPSPEVEVSPEVQQVFELRMREVDRMAERLTAKPSA